MGYYSVCENRGVQIKEKHLTKVKNDQKIIKDNESQCLYSSSEGEPKEFEILREKVYPTGDYVFWHIGDMVVEDNGYFYFEDECKFYGSDDFINYLAPLVTEGDLLFRGEDGEQWGYRFDGKGKVKGLKIQWVET